MAPRAKAKKVSKKNKKAWRKHVDISDVEAYLESERLDERLGGSYTNRKDEDLFQIDTSAQHVKKKDINKHENVDDKIKHLDLQCFSALKNTSAVPDPLKKRNRVRTKEERRHPIAKDQSNRRLRRATLRKKELRELQVYLNKRLQSLQSKKKWKINVENDAWDKDEKKTQLSKLQNWFNKNTIIHTIRNTNGMKQEFDYHPKSQSSNIPALVVPHPGTSYNPSYTDHENLREKVVEMEITDEKREAHLNRVTNGKHTHITQDQYDKNTLKEMTEGIPMFEESEDVIEDDDGKEFKSLNPPVRRDKKKTITQRNKARRLREEQLERKERKEERKKLRDIERIKIIQKEVEMDDKKSKFKALKRLKRNSRRDEEARRIGRNKFVENTEDFTLKEELTGSLRELVPQGNILKDKFVNLQKRSLLEVFKPQFKKDKKNVKAFVAATHRLEPTDKRKHAKKNRN